MQLLLSHAKQLKGKLVMLIAFFEIKYAGQVKERKLDVSTAVQQSSTAVDGDSKSGVLISVVMPTPIMGFCHLQDC